MAGVSGVLAAAIVGVIYRIAPEISFWWVIVISMAILFPLQWVIDGSIPEGLSITKKLTIVGSIFTVGMMFAVAL